MHLGIFKKITGKDYRSFVTDNILKPCGMLNTKFCDMDEVNENTAEGYVMADAQRNSNCNVL